MGDDRQPGFLRGLPPRSTGDSGGGGVSGDRAARVRAVTAAAAVLATLLVAGGLVTALLPHAGPDVPQGGGDVIAIPANPESSRIAVGHKAGAKLCAELRGVVTTGEKELSSLEVPKDLLASYERIAAVKSPNQPVYRNFVDLLKDPESVGSIADAQAMSTDFMTAAQADLATCG